MSPGRHAAGMVTVNAEVAGTAEVLWTEFDALLHGFAPEPDVPHQDTFPGRLAPRIVSSRKNVAESA